MKDEYNKMVDGNIPKDKSILRPLCISNFNRKRLHTFILMDDAAFVLKNERSPWFNWLCQLRHLNVTVFMYIQM